MFTSASRSLRRCGAEIQASLAFLREWPFLAAIAFFTIGVLLIAQQPLHYTINLGYEEGWHSDQPFARGWNTPEPYGASATDRSFRWTADASSVWLPGLGAQPTILTLDQLAATANPQATTGSLYIHADQMAVHQPLNVDRYVHLLVPPADAARGMIAISAPTFTPSGDPRILGVPIADVALTTLARSRPSATLFWPLVFLPIAWVTARRWCVGRTHASVGMLGVISLLLVAVWADRLRFAIAGGPIVGGALWGVIVASVVLWLGERYAPRLGIRPSPWLLGGVALTVFWLMTLRYGGRLYPESMVGDLGFHVNRQTEVINGLIHLVSRHRGIDFPYPSAVYILLAPLRLLPIAPETIVEWADALFGALGVLPIAYLTLRGLRNQRAALLAAVVYATLAPAMMALWWSFLAHIFTQEAVALLIALIIGLWGRLNTARAIALVVLGLSFIFLGHFGLWINVSLLGALLIPVVWWRYRSTPQIRSVYGLGAAFVIAEGLAIALFYSAYYTLIEAKIAQFLSGGMSAVQGGRTETSAQALLASLWWDGLVAHYALIGLPLALLGGYWLWRTQRNSPITWLFWGSVTIAVAQGTIPFITSSTITTRWLSFLAWVIAVGVAGVLDQVWRRGWWGRSAALLTVMWIGGNTLWLWVQALGYRIRPPEPF